MTQAILWVIVGVMLVLVWLLSPYVLGGLFDGDPGLLSRRVSALTLFGLILTLAIQRRELTAQREALQQQQAALEQQAAELLASRRELTKTSEAAIRSTHIELLKLSIDHPHLASVWPGGGDGAAEQNQQRLFANLIVSHQQTLYELELMNDERLHAAGLVDGSGGANLLPDRLRRRGPARRQQCGDRVGGLIPPVGRTTSRIYRTEKTNRSKWIAWMINLASD